MRPLSFSVSRSTQKEFGIALFSFGNFVGGSMILGQAFGQTGLSLTYFPAGIIFVLIIYSAALIVLERKNDRKVYGNFV